MLSKSNFRRFVNLLLSANPLSPFWLLFSFVREKISKKKGETPEEIFNRVEGIETILKRRRSGDIKFVNNDKGDD